MTDRPVEPDPEPPTRPRWGGAGAHLLIAVLCALLGFAVVLQVQRTAAGDTLAAARPDAFLPDLAGSLSNLGGRLSELGRREAALAAQSFYLFTHHIATGGFQNNLVCHSYFL